MARVTGFTAERMLEIEGTTIIGGTINEGGRLILSRRDGFTIDAGEVKGAKGDPGSGVSDVEITYQASNSGTVEPTGEWTTNVPIVHAGQYLWVKTLTTYADPDDPAISFTTTTFTVTRQPEKGADGRGITGQTILYQEGNSGVTAPTGDWLGSIPPVAPGKFLWTQTITTYTDDSTSTSYSVAKQGSDGTPGEDGSDGQTPYLHVAYANSANGVEDFSTTDPSGRAYMGTTTTFTEPDPTDPSVYKWSLIRGSSGTGISSSSVRYQASTSGTITPVGTWLVEVPHVSEGEFLWSRLITNFTDGASQTVYSVSKQGERGQAGSDGRGITSIVEEYYLSDSAITRTGGTWSETRPDWVAGKYYWTRSTINYTSGNPTTTDPICVSGESGSSGSDGRSIVDVDVYYYLSNSSASLIGGSWSTTAPVWTDGKYMWSKTVTTYSEGDPTESSPVCITGSAGQKGDTGPKGDAGRGVSGTIVRYAASTSGILEPVTGWTNTVPNVPDGQFLWTRTTTQYTEGPDTVAYSVSKMGEQGDPKYTWIMYADDQNGSGISHSPEGKTYIGVSANRNSPTESENALDYTWSLIKGADGSDGSDGADGRGIVSTEIRYQAGSSGTTAPTGTWQTSVPSVSAGQYLWTRTTVNYTSGTPSVSYSVGRMGTNGSNGTPGAPGANGQTSYLHVAYANSANGVENFSTSDPSGRAYMGTYTDFTEADSTTPGDYTWSLIKGADGSPGPAGKGIASTVINYAQSTSGTATPSSGWQTTIPSVPEGQYLWTRTRITFTDSAQTDTFTVAKQGAKGSPGADGTDGRGITSIVEEYYLSTSSTTQTGGSWGTSVPAWVDGRYYWTRSVINYTSGSPYMTTPVMVSGGKGATGASGADGRGITGAVTTYQVSSSGTTIPTGTWVANPPATTAGQYFWTRVVTSYTSGPDTTSYSVARHGATGSTGAQGLSVSSVTPYYQLGTTQPSVPTVLNPPSPWTTTEPTYTPGTTQNLYVVVRTVFSNNSFSYTPVSLSASFATSKAAHALASTAMSTADGKNKVVRSTGNAASPGSYQAGDQWWKFSGSEVIQFWLHSGTAWVSQTLTDSVITNLHAGTITAGTLSAERIAANSITASKILIGDTQNLISDPGFTDPDAWGTSSTREIMSRTAAGVPANAPVGNNVMRVASITGGNNDVIYRTGTLHNSIAVEPGEELYVEYWIARDAACNSNFRFFMAMRDAAGGSTSWPNGGSQSPASVPAGEWRKIVTKITVPAAKYQATLQFGSSNTGSTTPAGNWYVANPVYRRMNTGEMIVDGAIKSRTMDAEEIYANEAHVARLSAGIAQFDEITGLGNKLTISANESIELAVGRQNATDEQLSELRTDVDGAIDATEQAATVADEAHIAALAAGADLVAQNSRLVEVESGLSDQRAHFKILPGGVQVAFDNESASLDMTPESIKFVSQGTAVAEISQEAIIIHKGIFEQAQIGNHLMQKKGGRTTFTPIEGS